MKQLEQCLNLFWSQQTPMIVAPDILSKIEGQPFSADSPFGCQTPLEITPEALQAVDVAPLPIAERLAVVHKPVDVAPRCDARVAGKGVRADDGATLVQERQQRLGFHVRYHLRPHQATSTQDPKDSLLSGSTAPLRALNTLCQAPVAPGTSQVGLVDLHHAGEDMGNVPDHGLAHHDQGSQDSLSLQAGLLGNHLGTLPQDEPAQQSPPLPWRQPKRQRPGHPLVVAGCTTTLTSPNAPALGVLTSRAPNLPSHATILSQVAVLGLYPLLIACTSRADTTPTPPAPLLTRSSLSAAELSGLNDAGIRAAIEELRQRVEDDTKQVQILRAEKVTWSDSSLGCPEPGMLYTQVLTPGVWLILSHGEEEFDYRIAGSEALLCIQSQRSEPVERQPLGGVWSRQAPMPTSRSEVAAAALDGKIYVLGGFGRGATANEEYDPETNTWRQRAPIPRGVDHAAAVALGGKIYLIGGFDGRFRPVDTVWSYAPESDIWTRRADLPAPRGALGAVAVDGKIYAIGGRGAERDVGTTEEYDPATDTWRPRSPMPTPRDHIAISVVEGKIYVIGGRLGTFARNLADNEEYDPVTDTWKRRAPLPTVRSGIAAATVNGTIYVFGGEDVAGTFDANERYEAPHRHLGNHARTANGQTRPGGCSFRQSNLRAGRRPYTRRLPERRQ